MTEERPNPEKLLELIKAEELQDSLGKLKIYLGAAPGVGKTYTMLKDAIAQRANGLDVVVGIIESHGRKDIEELLVGLEVLPRQKIDYKGRTIYEFDLDAALKRNPGLILMDEMAHTNVAGLRHVKRWQDIKELLDRGINVNTTLNVQHIESLSDDVAGIIHAPVKETVPDIMIDLADTIELIDLPPEDLLKRLEEGKVYFPEHAELAKEGFFRKGNLIALRELALRVTAERVGAQVLLYRQGLGIKHIWSCNEKILVCVGSGSESVQLIRAARRLANSLQAEWIAVHIDSPRVNLSEEQRNNAIKNLQLANKLGAETVTLTGLDLVKEIMTYAREQNVTLIMIWKQIYPRWKDFFKQRLADELVRNSQEINVYIMTGRRDSLEEQKNTSSTRKLMGQIYLITLGIIVAITAMNLLLFKYVDSRVLIIIYLIGVTIVSLFGKVGPSIVASVLSVVAYGLFFLPNLFKFSTIDLGYLATLAIMILLTQIISYLTIRTQRQADAARLAERQTVTLHKLSKRLASSRGVGNLLDIGVNYMAEVFASDSMALLPEDDKLVIKARSNPEQTISAKELSVAQWVFDLGQIAGLGTDTLPFSDAIYIPLLGSHGTIGVLRIKPEASEILFTAEQMSFIETCANQLALAIEVDRLQEKNKQSELEQTIDHTRNMLLQSVSHDLRAPLASIMLSASTQMQLAKELTPENIKKIGQNIYNETDQLRRLINNLLQITYLESSSIKLQKVNGSLKELITKVLKTSRGKIGKTPIYINIPIEVPNIPFDHTLLEGVVLNLLDNALKFAPLDKPIEIFVAVNHDTQIVIVSIEDRGPGIVSDEKNKVFDKFYRGRLLTNEHGLGLGLAICKMIVEAHGGKIWVENRDGGGAAFRFSLPIKG